LNLRRQFGQGKYLQVEFLAGCMPKAYNCMTMAYKTLGILQKDLQGCLIIRIFLRVRSTTKTSRPTQKIPAHIQSSSHLP
jgi:hypothetical protein